MDKYEYRIRAEEINDLIEKKEYVQAVKIADTIDWRRVRSVVMLCKISELYKINRRYEDSKEVLLLAYELQGNSRKIIYSLCELSIKLDETVQAVEYYKDDVVFVGSQKGANLWQYRLDGTMISNVSLSAFASEVAGLCYDEQTGHLWVVDSKKAKIFVCSVAGELYSAFDIPYVDNAESICIDRGRNCVWVGSDEDNSKLYKINFDF